LGSFPLNRTFHLAPRMPERSTAAHGRRFPHVIISHAVWLYLRFPLSFRDVEELLAERGIEVSYESIRRWVATFGPRLAEELRTREAKPGRVWHLDEMAVRIGGKRYWLWRAVDEHGRTLDVLLQERRDTEAAERFFRALVGHAGGVPERITTDKLGSYTAAKRRIPELDGVEHQQVRSSMRCNNRVEQAHQPTRIRERRMGRFRCPASTQQFLSAVARISNLFRPRRHLLRSSEYHSILRERFLTWREVAALVVA
jgi:putative transposase